MAHLWDTELGDEMCNSQQCLQHELCPGSLTSQSVQCSWRLVEMHAKELQVQGPEAIKIGVTRNPGSRDSGI